MKKRKAQNRAAQRAFRERKEKHLKDLEQKVEDLEKSSEATNKENSALRQQIERLQTELSEYRKRINESKANFSNILGKGSSGGFHFEFPMFGLGMPNMNMNDNKPKATQGKGAANSMNILNIGPGTLLGRARSSITPSSNGPAVHPAPSYDISNPGTRGFNNSPQMASGTAYSAYYTHHSTIGSLNKDPSSEYVTKSEGYMHSRDTPMSHRTDSSPSASSVSHHTTSSSVTSPESNTHSPLVYKQDQLEPVTEETMPVIANQDEEPGFVGSLLDDGESSFCEKLGAIACGYPNGEPLDPDSGQLPKLNDIIPRPDPTLFGSRNNEKAGAANISNVDPVLFNDWRDPMDQANLDLNMSFFDDAFPMTDFSLGTPVIPGTPVPERSEPEVRKPVPAGLVDEIGSSDEDDDMVVPPSKHPAGTNLMSCNKIWYVYDITVMNRD